MIIYLCLAEDTGRPECLAQRGYGWPRYTGVCVCVQVGRARLKCQYGVTATGRLADNKKSGMAIRGCYSSVTLPGQLHKMMEYLKSVKD